MRKSGILMPVFSLPGEYGIGTFGKEAYQWVDFLKQAKQSCWQVLPLGPTSYGDSPYQSFSAFAGNPYFIDLEILQQEGLLTEEELQQSQQPMGNIDYGTLYQTRFLVLKKAFSRFAQWDELEEYSTNNAQWLKDYALYMAIKQANGQRSWAEWPQPLRMRQPQALQQAEQELKQEIQFYCFLQYEFSRQWGCLKAYANQNGISIIGDMPIYVAMDSADVWANPEYFLLDENNQPIEVAGCPPDAFSEDGQLWGNPLYRWDVLAQTGYDWWLRRVKAGFEMYDTIRIDHFRGLESYYAIPYGETTARNGQWRKGPDWDFVKTLHQHFGKKGIIAEDLGFLTPAVHKLLKKSGYPGMKVLQFAFDSREESDYLPHNYDKNCVVYTGTHDNDTVVSWFHTVPKRDVAFAKNYMGIRGTKGGCQGMIRLAMASVADLAVIPIQDYLELGSEARINTPSTLGNNWMWRMEPQLLTDTLAQHITQLTQLYGRAPKTNKKQKRGKNNAE